MGGKSMSRNNGISAGGIGEASVFTGDSAGLESPRLTWKRPVRRIIFARDAELSIRVGSHDGLFYS